MSHKLLPRLGSAIASTILSYAAVSLGGVDKAEAATLTYNFDVGGKGRGFLKVNNSSLTELGFYNFQETFVSEGRLYGFTFPDLGSEKEYDDLAGATAIFRAGEFYGFIASGRDSGVRDYIIPPDEPSGPQFFRIGAVANWTIYGTTANWAEEASRTQFNYQSYIEDGSIVTESQQRLYRYIVPDARVSYTLVNTEAEPVPEPLTVGTAAVALAGLSWLKHKKKMAG